MAQTTTRRRGSQSSSSSSNGSSSRAPKKKSEVLDGSKDVAKGGGRKRVNAATNGNARSRGSARSGAASASTRKATSALSSEHTPSLPKPHSLGGKLALAAVKKITKSFAHAAAEALHEVTEPAVTAVRERAESLNEADTGRRLPIQVSIDIAVPVRVAWEEWMAFDALPEGIHTVTGIERDGDDALTGRTSSAHAQEWSAEILDEREEQSFAWQSDHGSDCAGLVTFHELSDRLTRVELSLDLVPTTVAEHMALITHLANRKARSDLRRLKERLELISPDAYPRPAAPADAADEPQRAEETEPNEDEARDERDPDA